MKKLLIIMLFMSNFIFAKMTIGVTMLPYYSFVSNIVGDKMNVISIVPENINSHNYEPTFQDLKKLKTVDILVVNGIGHDTYADDMLKTIKNNKIKVINANKNVSLMNVSGFKSRVEVNMHTFISISKTIEQVNEIANELGKIDKVNKKYYLQNASKYNKKLRMMLINAKKQIKGININNVKIATTHGGYDYLLADFGLVVEAVVESSFVHSPTATDLKNAIDKIKKDKIDILFDEKTGNHKNASIIKKETGVYISYLNHLTNGKFTADNFEIFIKQNLDNIVSAIKSIKE